MTIKNHSAIELKNALEAALADKQQLEKESERLAGTEVDISFFMKRYQDICEDMRDIYQGETAGLILEQMAEDGRQGEKEMRLELRDRQEEVSDQYRRLQFREEELYAAYRLQQLGEEDDD